MQETTIRLGRGIMKNASALAMGVPVNEKFFLDEIREYGISSDALRKIKPSYDDLLEIYSELKTFGFSTKYYQSLRGLHGSF